VRIVWVVIVFVAVVCWIVFSELLLLVTGDGRLFVSVSVLCVSSVVVVVLRFSVVLVLWMSVVSELLSSSLWSMLS